MRGIRERVFDNCKNALDIVPYFIVPKTQDAITIVLKKVGSAGIYFGLIGMVAAIQFDDKAGFQTGEIHDIRTARDLAAKLATFQLAVAQMTPQNFLCFSLMVA